LPWPRAVAAAKPEAIPLTRLYRGARGTSPPSTPAVCCRRASRGKRAADCERILRGLGIDQDIDEYLGGDSVARPKPAPGLAQHAMARLRVTSDETVVIGDSPADLAMGGAAGARTIQVLWGFAGAPLSDADHVVRTWRELRDLVLRLAGRKPSILASRGPLRP
jgi:phosphoglycolate phosphatase